MATETVVPVQEQTASRLRNALRKCFSFPVLLGAILISAVFIIERSIRLDPDTWWHIKVGSDILAVHHFPKVDLYSSTARGAPWIAYEWLGDAMMALVGRAGLRGIEFLLIAGSSAIVLLIYYYAWLGSKKCKAAFLATIAVMPLAALSMTVRPQIFGYAFLLITLICLELFRQGHLRALWALPPVFLLWVNTHGSFVLGFMAFGLYWVGGLVDFSWGGLYSRRWAPPKRIRLELAALACVLMLPITPYGTRLAMVPIEYAFSLPGNMAHIQEWQPADFSQWQMKLFLVLVLVFLIANLTVKLRCSLVEASFFIFATFETCVHVRFAIVFAIVFAPVLAAILTRWVDTYNPAIDKHGLNAMLVLTMAFTWVRYFPSRAALERKITADFPVQAVRYLRQHPVSGPMFNNYGFGGYLIWAGEPAYGVFIDGRGDLYENAGVFADYRRIVTLAPDIQQLLEKYDIQSCLIQRGTPLATFIAGNPRWTRVYQDKLSDLYVRNNHLKVASPARSARISLPKGLS